MHWFKATLANRPFRNLFDLCPRIKDMAHQLEWSVYCSYRQEYPERCVQTYLLIHTRTHWASISSKGQFGLEIVEEFGAISNLCVCMPSLFTTSHVVVERLLEKIKCQLEGHTLPTSSPPLSDDHIFSKSPRSSELSRSMALLSGIEINVKKIEKKISEGTLKATPREDTDNTTNVNNNGDSPPPKPANNNNVNSNNTTEERGMLSSVNSDSDLIILEEEITLLMLKDKMDEIRKQNAMNNSDSSSSNNNNTNHDSNGSLPRSLNVNSVNRRNEESLSPKPWDRKYHPNENVSAIINEYTASSNDWNRLPSCKRNLAPKRVTDKPNPKKQDYLGWLMLNSQQHTLCLLEDIRGRIRTTYNCVLIESCWICPSRWACNSKPLVK